MNPLIRWHGWKVSKLRINHSQSEGDAFMLSEQTIQNKKDSKCTWFEKVWITECFVFLLKKNLISDLPGNFKRFYP